MRFESRARINGTVDEVEAALIDDRYLDFLLKHHGVLLEVQLLEKKDEGDKIRRKVRYRPKPVIDVDRPEEGARRVVRLRREVHLGQDAQAS